MVWGVNVVGYIFYFDNVIYDFFKKVVEVGFDIFWVFDFFNYFENLKVGIDVVKKVGGVVEGIICYFGDVVNFKKIKYIF